MNICHSMTIWIHFSKNLYLVKLWYHVTADVLKTIYYALVYSHMRNAYQIWEQNQSKLFDMIQCVQNKPLRTKSFK